MIIVGVWHVERWGFMKNNLCRKKGKHKQYSLVLGRFQPPHEGHFALIRKILSEGKNVCIALRKADLTSENPFDYEQRALIFYREFEKEIWEGKIKVIFVPDIVEICYGRKVGWGIRKVELPKKIEGISATEIRKEISGGSSIGRASGYQSDDCRFKSCPPLQNFIQQCRKEEV